jgi:hypothetical protein
MAQPALDQQQQIFLLLAQLPQADAFASLGQRKTAAPTLLRLVRALAGALATAPGALFDLVQRPPGITPRAQP